MSNKIEIAKVKLEKVSGGGGKAEHEFLSRIFVGDLSSSYYHFKKLSLASRSSYPDMKSPFNVWYVVF